MSLTRAELQRVVATRAGLREEHLTWQGYSLVGLTPRGRALIAAFDLNHERRCRVRQAEELFGLFPPAGSL